MKMSDTLKNLNALYSRIDARATEYGKISEEEILREIKKYKSEKKRKHTGSWRI